jgi:hypothetical protein
MLHPSAVTHSNNHSYEYLPQTEHSELFITEEDLSFAPTTSTSNKKGEAPKKPADKQDTVKGPKQTIHTTGGQGIANHTPYAVTPKTPFLTKAYDYTFGPIFALKHYLVKGIAFCTKFVYTIPLKALVTLICYPFDMGVAKYNFKGSLNTKTSLTFNQKLKKTPILRHFIVTLTLLPMIPLMILEPTTALIALGLTIRCGRNFLNNFENILMDPKKLKKVKLQSNNFYDKHYDNKTSWQQIKAAWSKKNMTNNMPY